MNGKLKLSFVLVFGVVRVFLESAVMFFEGNLEVVKTVYVGENPWDVQCGVHSR